MLFLNYLSPYFISRLFTMPLMKQYRTYIFAKKISIVIAEWSETE